MKVIADAQNLIEVPSKNYPCSNALLLFFRVLAQKNPTKPNHTKKKQNLLQKYYRSSKLFSRNRKWMENLMFSIYDCKISCRRH